VLACRLSRGYILVLPRSAQSARLWNWQGGALKALKRSFQRNTNDVHALTVGAVAGLALHAPALMESLANVKLAAAMSEGAPVPECILGHCMHLLVLYAFPT
jgi:hypothetical protein